MSQDNNVVYRNENGIDQYIYKGGPDYIIEDPFVNWVSPNKNLIYPESDTIQLESRRTTFAPNTLGMTTKVYKTPNTQDVKDLCDYYADFGYSYDVQTGPVYTLTVQVPFDEITEQDYFVNIAVLETWEIVPNIHAASILSAPAYKTPGMGVGTDNTVILDERWRAAVQQSYNQNTTFVNLPVGIASDVSASLSPQLPYAQKYLMMMRAGITSVPWFGQTIKRTSVIDVSNFNQSFTTYGDKLFQDAQKEGTRGYLLSKLEMLDSYSIPKETVGKFMNASYRKKMSIASAISGSSSVEVLTYAGYLVQPPTFQFVTRNKVQLTQLFIWDEWVADFYNIPGGQNMTYYPQK